MSESVHKNKVLSRYRREKLVRAFADDLTAGQAATAAGVNRNTVNRYYATWRAAIHASEVREQTQRANLPDPLPHQPTPGLAPVVGLFERGDRVFAEIAPTMLGLTLEPVMRGSMPPARARDAPGWRGYDAVAGWTFATALRVAGEPGPAEAFWAFTRDRLKRFRGVRAPEVHLSECAWRWGKDAEAVLAALRTLP